MQIEDRIDRVHTHADDYDDILWGCEDIGRAIDRNPRQTNWLLTRGEIKCAMKKGKFWIAPAPRSVENSASADTCRTARVGMPPLRMQ